MFNRNKNTAPQFIAPKLPQPELEIPAQAAEERLFPIREAGHLYETSGILENLQQNLLDECSARNLDEETTKDAIIAAMQTGAHPAALLTRPRRDNKRVVSFMHGALPREAIDVTQINGALFVKLTKPVNGGEWPSKPNPDDPDAFYIESFVSPPESAVPHSNDNALNQANARAFRDLNDKLSDILPLKE